MEEVTARIGVRLAREDDAVRALPRNFCRCAEPLARLEDGVLLVCVICSREVGA